MLTPQVTEMVLRHRPSVHRLVYGTFLQDSVAITAKTFAIPLRPLGFDHVAEYIAEYHLDALRYRADEAAIREFAGQGRSALPAVALICMTSESEAAGAMEAEAQRELDRAEEIIGWISGDYPETFAYVINSVKGGFFRAVPPHSRFRQHLGPGVTGAAFGETIERVIAACDDDEHFSFSLSLMRDALHEKNKRFQIARLFNVLESLAYAIKAKPLPSRKAVRELLGGASTGEASLPDGIKVKFDRVELGGRLRDRLFHGAQFEALDLTVEWRDSFRLISEFPDILISALLADCEMQIARWANGVSEGLLAAKALKKVAP